MTPFEIASLIILVPAAIALAVLEVAHQRWRRGNRRAGR